MKTIRKPKIGLVGMMATPFRGDKEGFFAADTREMNELASEWHFDLKVIPEGIYNFENAVSAAQALSDWGADYVLVQSSSFAGGDFIRPFARMGVLIGLWGVPEGPPGPEGGLPLNSFTGMNLYNSVLRTVLDVSKVKWFFGRPSDNLFRTRFQVTVMALRALVNLQGAQIGLIGGVAPGFDNLIVDPRDYEGKLGIRVRSLELDAVLRIARGLIDQEEIERRANKFIRPGVRLAKDGHAHLLELARLEIAFEQLVEEYEFDALAISCWPRFQAEPGVAVCSLLGQLNTLGMPAACEGDLPSAVAMLALRLLTGGDPNTLMDLVSVDSDDNSALLWHCGPTSPLLADEGGVEMGSLWLFDKPDGGTQGLHNNLQLRPGAVTLMGLTPSLDGMLVVSGQIDNKKPSYKGSRGWLMDLRINTQSATVPDLVETLMVSGFQHHYPLAYGDLAEACLELGTLLGIPPITRQVSTTYLKG